MEAYFIIIYEITQTVDDNPLQNEHFTFCSQAAIQRPAGRLRTSRLFSKAVFFGFGIRDLRKAKKFNGIPFIL